MMNAIEAINRMTGKYRVVRTDPLNQFPPEEDQCNADAKDFWKRSGLHGNIKLQKSYNCYDSNDIASIDTNGVVRILTTAPNKQVWLDTFTPVDSTE